jgi:hypothetical protein
VMRRAGFAWSVRIPFRVAAAARSEAPARACLTQHELDPGSIGASSRPGAYLFND